MMPNLDCRTISSCGVNLGHLGGVGHWLVLCLCDSHCVLVRDLLGRREVRGLACAGGVAITAAASAIVGWWATAWHSSSNAGNGEDCTDNLHLVDLKMCCSRYCFVADIVGKVEF